jgi:hypothetical protein
MFSGLLVLLKGDSPSTLKDQLQGVLPDQHTRCRILPRHGMVPSDTRQWRHVVPSPACAISVHNHADKIYATLLSYWVHIIKSAIAVFTKVAGLWWLPTAWCSCCMNMAALKCAVCCLWQHTHITFDTDSVCSFFWYTFYGWYYWRQCAFEANRDRNIQFCMRDRGILVLLQAWYKPRKSTFQTLRSTAVIILSLPRILTTAYHFGGIFQTIL